MWLLWLFPRIRSDNLYLLIKKRNDKSVAQLISFARFHFTIHKDFSVFDQHVSLTSAADPFEELEEFVKLNVFAIVKMKCIHAEYKRGKTCDIRNGLLMQEFYHPNPRSSATFDQQDIQEAP